jgi:hypothetical protein
VGEGSITHDWCKYVENKALRMKTSEGAGLTRFGEKCRRGKTLSGNPFKGGCIQPFSKALFPRLGNSALVTKKKKKMQRHVSARVKAIPSSEPDARDEGPRLLPLRNEKDDEFPMSHYLQLADTALGTAARPAKIKKQYTPEQADADDSKKSE